jgi:hypothetical protein
MRKRLIRSSTTNGKRRGCAFYGCLVILLVCLVLFLGCWLMWSQVVVPFVEQHSSPTQVGMTSQEIPAERIEDLRASSARFFEGIDAGRPVEVLTLDSADLGLVLRMFPELFPLAENTRLGFEGQRLRGEFTFPLDDFGLTGRFVNLSGTFDLSVRGEMVFLTPYEVWVNGKLLPDSFIQELRTINMVEKFSRSQKMIERVRRIQKIEIRDEKIFVIAK